MQKTEKKNVKIIVQKTEQKLCKHFAKDFEKNCRKIVYKQNKLLLAKKINKSFKKFVL